MRHGARWLGKVPRDSPLPAEGRGYCEPRPSLRLEQEGIRMSAPKEIGHIVLNVTDVERSTRLYRDVVGFQVSRYRPDGTGAFLTCGAVHHNLALFKAPAGARPTEKGAIGLNHFAFKVESHREPPRAEIPKADFTRVG